MSYVATASLSSRPAVAPRLGAWSWLIVSLFRLAVRLEDMKKPLAGRGGRATWDVSAAVEEAGSPDAAAWSHRNRNVLVRARGFLLGAAQDRPEQVRRVA